MKVVYRFFVLLFIFVSFYFCFTDSAMAVDYKTELKSADDSISTIISQKNIVKSEWYPHYHFAANAYCLELPVALTSFNGNYHLFYTHKIKTISGEKVYWANTKSPDLIHWKNLKTAIAPYDAYDKDGLSGGSAIVDDNEKILYLLYSGLSETKTSDKSLKHETQNLAMSKDGLNFGKSANNPVIKMAPHYSYLTFSSSDFKDPFVWKMEDRYYALVGTQYEKTKDGAVLLFKSKDLRNWVCINVTALGKNSEMGYLWENPALLHIAGNDVLSISVRGIKPHGKMFLNKYQSGAFIGKLDYNTGKFSQKGPFYLFDYGFDFYAPKFIKLSDGRYVYVAKLGMDGSSQPESADGWAGILTIPRELKIVKGKILSYPIKELEKLRHNKVVLNNLSFTGEREFSNIKGDVYELVTAVDMTNSKCFKIKFRTSSSHETVLSYDKNIGLLKLNRDKSGKGLSGEREVKLPLDNNILKLRVFVDKSSIEVFANDGVAVLSSRIYPDKNANGVKFFSDGQAKINELSFYKLSDIYKN